MLQLSAHLRQTFNYGQNVIELSVRHGRHVAGIVIRLIDRARNTGASADDRTCGHLEVSCKTGSAAGLNVVADNRASGQTSSSGKNHILADLTVVTDHD